MLSISKLRSRIGPFIVSRKVIVSLLMHMMLKWSGGQLEFSMRSMASMVRGKTKFYVPCAVKALGYDRLGSQTNGYVGSNNGELGKFSAQFAMLVTIIYNPRVALKLQSSMHKFVFLPKKNLCHSNKIIEQNKLVGLVTRDLDK